MRKIFNGERIVRQGQMYEQIKDKAEDEFVNAYRDNDYISIEGCIKDAIDYHWDDILEDEDYEEIEDEDRLYDLLFKCIDYDLDEEEIIDDLSCGDGYWGLSPRQRNYGFR